MPRIDFNNVDDVQDFSPLPDGKYLCRVAEVEEAATQYGDEMWKLRFVVESGPHRGRYIFDNMVFSDAAMKRVKLICSRLGLDISRELDLTPALIKGRSCYVAVETEEYEDQEGNAKKRNVVPFAGYERADGAPAATTPPAAKASGAEDDSEEDLPF
ncbi:MAG: DUF669 domain-containing protein [Planctomycetes bacterium]|nr:DUF669 domain-containing protein [Planctomycetota bacterium]